MRLGVWEAVALACLVAACSGDAATSETSTERGTTTPPVVVSLAATSTSTTLAPGTTSTSMTPTPTLPAELEAKYPVIFTQGLRGPETQDIAVWAPEADGLWPIVIIYHGTGSQGTHYAETASLLASQGVVVFAPDYRSTLIPTPDWKDAYRDAECAYRHIRVVAEDHGGSTAAPITVVGHSIGASVGMSIVLDETTYGPGGEFDACPSDAPRPEQLVAMSGCYYKSPAGMTFPFTPTEYGWAHHDANIQLVVGSADEVCEPWQSEDAETQLIADGYQTLGLTVVDDADHFSVIFTGYENGPWYGPNVEWFALPNDAGGIAATQIILDAVNAGEN